MKGSSLRVSDLILLSLLATIIDQGLSLTCFCQNSRLCDGEEDVCEGQDDVCFTRVSRDGVYESACRTVGSDDFLARLAADCLNGTISIGATILCCNDHDRCNEDLRPTLQPNSNTGSSSSTTIAGPGPRATDDPNNPLYIGLTAAIPVLALIVITVIITMAVLYSYRPRNRPRQHIPTTSSSRNLLIRIET